MKYIFRIFISTLLPLAIFTQLSWSGISKHGNISVENNSWDFGYVPIDYKFIHIYKIRNVGDGDLHITKLVPNCDCTIAIPSNTLIPPDSSIEVKIVFDTKNYYGQNNRAVTVHSDDPDNPTIVLEYSSNIGFMPKLHKIEPRSLFFLPGHKLKTIKLINMSEDDTEYSLEMEPDSFFSIEELNGKVETGRTVMIDVKAKESLPKGTYYSSFRVRYDIEPKAIYISVPVKIVRY